MNIIIIGNCQIQSIANGLELSNEVDEVVQFPIHLKGNRVFSEALDYVNVSEKEWIVLTFRDLLDEINFSEVIKSKFKKIITFTNIYFTGLFPDQIYLGGMGDRLISAAGDYHSLICALSFLKGLNIDSCIKKYNDEVYSSLGYYDYWRVSKEELLNRDALLDIKFAQIFLEMASKTPVLHTFNHPTAEVLLTLVNLILNHIGLEKISFPSNFFYSHLASNTWWPVYPEIAKKFGIQYSTGMFFKSPDHIKRKIYNLNEFVGLTYKKYEDYGREKILISPLIEAKINIL
jgi:hypothetical protein